MNKQITNDEANQGRTAVVLSGGGAFGAYEVGVMKALIDGKSPSTGYAPLTPDIFAGTSIGAYNAAMMVSQAGPPTTSHLEDIWANQLAENPQRSDSGTYRFRGNVLRVANPERMASHPIQPLIELVQDAAFLTQDWLNRTIDFALSDKSLEQRALEFANLSAFISREPFERVIEETLPFKAIRESDKVLKIAATNWKTGELKVFQNEAFTDEVGPQIIMASTAIPGTFPPVFIDEQPYVDGGVVMNIPLSTAIREGADTLHVIYLNTDVENLPLERLQNGLDVLYRMFSIWQDTLLNQNIKRAETINRELEAAEKGRTVPGEDTETNGSLPRRLTIHRYHPREELDGVLGVLSFNQQRILDLMEKGLAETAEHDCTASECVLP